jgi:hypothetical protein
MVTVAQPGVGAPARRDRRRASRAATSASSASTPESLPPNLSLSLGTSSRRRWPWRAAMRCSPTAATSSTPWFIDASRTATARWCSRPIRPGLPRLRRACARPPVAQCAPTTASTSARPQACRDPQARRASGKAPGPTGEDACWRRARSTRAPPTRPTRCCATWSSAAPARGAGPGARGRRRQDRQHQRPPRRLVRPASAAAWRPGLGRHGRLQLAGPREFGGARRCRSGSTTCVGPGGPCRKRGLQQPPHGHRHRDHRPATACCCRRARRGRCPSDPGRGHRRLQRTADSDERARMHARRVSTSSERPRSGVAGRTAPHSRPRLTTRGSRAMRTVHARSHAPMHMPPSTPHPHPTNARQRLAHEAARLMAEGGIRDYHQAKLKAASGWASVDDAALPRNARSKRRCASTSACSRPAQPQALRERREAALRGAGASSSASIRGWSAPVLDGTADQHSPVCLHLYCDDARGGRRFLEEHGIPASSSSRRCAWTASAARCFPCGCSAPTACLRPDRAADDRPAPGAAVAATIGR